MQDPDLHAGQMKEKPNKYYLGKGRVGECGGPYGDAVRAENGAATVAQLAAAAATAQRTALGKQNAREFEIEQQRQ